MEWEMKRYGVHVGSNLGCIVESGSDPLECAIPARGLPPPKWRGRSPTSWSTAASVAASTAR
eukprot:8570104-Pyramimonas_sp.AAC.1